MPLCSTNPPAEAVKLLSCGRDVSEWREMPRNRVDYDDDFYAWTAEQARLLREGELSLLDVENIAEELESMGRSDRRQLEHRLEILLLHLLKWQVQISFRSPSWSATIREQRRRIERLFRESPSLRPVLKEVLADCFAEARERAVGETGFPHEAFPAECPYTSDQIMSASFFPE